jgi:hypothetical protein
VPAQTERPQGIALYTLLVGTDAALGRAAIMMGPGLPINAHRVRCSQANRAKPLRPHLPPGSPPLDPPMGEGPLNGGKGLWDW